MSGGWPACAGSGLTAHCPESGTGELALPGAVPSGAAVGVKGDTVLRAPQHP